MNKHSSHFNKVLIAIISKLLKIFSSLFWLNVANLYSQSWWGQVIVQWGLFSQSWSLQRAMTFSEAQGVAAEQATRPPISSNNSPVALTMIAAMGWAMLMIWSIESGALHNLDLCIQNHNWVALILKNIFAYTIHCLSLFNIISAVCTSLSAGATGTFDPGEFATFSTAVNSLSNNGSSQTIFIYPGNLHHASIYLLLHALDGMYLSFPTLGFETNFNYSGIWIYDRYVHLQKQSGYNSS